MAALTLRRNIFDGVPHPTDYGVYWNGRSIGRIRLAEERAGRTDYDWAINLTVPIPAWCHGSEIDLEAAKVAIKAAWAKFLPTLSEERLKQAFSLEDGANERFGRK